MTFAAKKAKLITRLGEHNLKQWTRTGNNTNQDSIDDDRLEAAMEDAEADYRDLAGIIFDYTNPLHKFGLYTDRVKYHLLKNGGHAFGGVSKLGQETTGDLEKLRMRTNANRYSPELREKVPLQTPYIKQTNNLGYDLGSVQQRHYTPHRNY